MAELKYEIVFVVVETRQVSTVFGDVFVVGEDVASGRYIWSYFPGCLHLPQLL